VSGWVSCLNPTYVISNRTFEEAIDNITEAIELYVESLLADNQPIPKEDLIVKPLSIFL